MISERPLDRCPACDSRDLDFEFDFADAVCNDCGLVIRDANNPPEIPETDIFGQEVDPSEQSWEDYYTVHDSTEARLAKTYAILEVLADQLNISIESRLKSADIIKDAAIEGEIDGRRTEYVVAAAIYLAAKESDEIRPLSVIAETVGTDEPVLNRLVRSLQRELDIKRMIPGPASYIAFINAELSYPDHIIEAALEIISEAEDANLVQGRHPSGVAAAALYLASDGPHSQRKLASIAGVTKETLRVRLMDFREAGIGHD